MYHFIYKAFDGFAYSDPATVSVTVNPFNDAPVANSQSPTTDEDTALSIVLTANDPDGDSLEFTIVSQPVNGTLSGALPPLPA